MEYKLSKPEGTRKLDSIKFNQGTEMSVDLPCDTVFKRLRSTLRGFITTTYGSGTPLADSFSTFDNLVSVARVTVNGSTTIKAVRPWMQQQFQLLMSGVLAERKSSAGASAAFNDNPTVDGGFVYGTTGQISTVRESFDLYFECPLLRPEERYLTMLNLQDASTAQLKFSGANFARLLAFGNTAPVVFSADNLYIDTIGVENRNIPKDAEFFDYVQTYREENYTAAGNGFKIKLPVSQFLMGISIVARGGEAGSSTTATGKLPTDNLISNMTLKINGRDEKWTGTFQELSAENRSRYGVVAPNVANANRLQGFALLNLLQDGVMGSALDCRRLSGVQDVDLIIDLLSGADYTSSATVGVETHEWMKRG